MTIRHILLTTDFSEDSRRAYAPAVELAQQVGARITLLYVVQALVKVPPGAMLAQPLVMGDVEDEMKSARESLKNEVLELGDAQVSTDVVTSDTVANGVVEFARTHDVDLIALSSHGRSGIRRLVLGSVAEMILRHSQVPVLCLPPSPHEDE